MDEYRRANLALWNDWTRIHTASEFYDVAGFLAGRNTLLPLERGELGDVAGKRLLHLQCHFGLDTLSLARMGARVVGVDFSDEAIAAARRLASEIDSDAVFVQADIMDLGAKTPPEWDAAFDIVFVTYGAIEWLQDLQVWADLIARCLTPGGQFYMAEVHPYAYTLELEELPGTAPQPMGGSGDATAHAGAEQVVDAAALAGGDPSLRYRLVQTYSYFAGEEPERDEVEGSYADPTAHVEHNVAYSWPHTIAEVLDALLGRGLTLESFREHPFCCAPFWPQMQKLDDGVYWLLDERGQPREDIPFLYSLRARKPG